MLVTADELQYDQDLGLIIAKGHVELSQDDQILLADTVTYNQRTDTVTASGHVSMTQPTGDVVFADYMELHDNFRDGFIKDVRMLLSDGSRLAGNTARRVGGMRTEVRRARLFALRALRRRSDARRRSGRSRPRTSVDDKEPQIVEYHDAIMEIDGFPVFYSPYFSHPDPSVKRASGFLPPGDRPRCLQRLSLRHPLLLGARSRQGRDLPADLHDRGRHRARRRVPPALRQRLAGDRHAASPSAARAIDPRVSHRRRDQHRRCAAISTPTGVWDLNAELARRPQRHRDDATRPICSAITSPTRPTT